MHYLTDDTYRKLVATLAKLKPDPLSGGLENQIKIILGEVGDVWPDTIREANDPRSALPGDSSMNVRHARGPGQVSIERYGQKLTGGWQLTGPPNKHWIAVDSVFARERREPLGDRVPQAAAEEIFDAMVEEWRTAPV